MKPYDPTLKRNARIPRSSRTGAEQRLWRVPRFDNRQVPLETEAVLGVIHGAVADHLPMQ